ncbi:hypothetical protein ACLJJ6_02480 [Pediococcus siamensis]|uniref:hypothetical protein n=1 Tax=Pediococcus siamensis TaxID=381829 RepID=UPI0039A2EDA5
MLATMFPGSTMKAFDIFYALNMNRHFQNIVHQVDTAKVELTVNCSQVSSITAFIHIMSSVLANGLMGLFAIIKIISFRSVSTTFPPI